MKEAYLEHANITVSNPDATASILCNIFAWKVRWSGEAMDNGYTVHVGGTDSYLAIYTNDQVSASASNDFKTIKNLNHLGIIVDDLALIEARVLAADCKPHNHRHYQNKDSSSKPSSNFYFHIIDDLEKEVIHYDN
ncbi:MAG: hypothetical protein JKX81_15825 [Arenicella sp.]|nr:hypothetical protein [Arenicella sp.]